MVYAGLVKRANSHFENCNNYPTETHTKGNYSTFWPHGDERARRPRGLNVKTNNVWKKFSLNVVGFRQCAFVTLHIVDIKNTLSQNSQQCNCGLITVISLLSASFLAFHTHGVNSHAVFPNFNSMDQRNLSYCSGVCQIAAGSSSVLWKIAR